MTNIKTQSLTEKGDAFYAKKARAVSTNSTHIENNTTNTITRVEPVFVHAVATSNIVQSGRCEVDGYSVKSGDYVLCAQQNDATKRGVLKVDTSGDWEFTDDELHEGLMVVVAFGNVFAGSVWVCQEPTIPSPQNTVESSWVYFDNSASAVSKAWSRTRKLVHALFDKLMCLIEEIKPYEVICHADTLPVPFNVLPVTETTIPFTTIRYEPSDGSFSGGQFHAGRSGYYDVDVLIVNEGITAPNYRIWLRITGSLDTYIADTMTVGADGFRLQGSRKVYCEEGGYIEATLYHAGAFFIGLNTATHPGGYGYISISFAGKIPAAKNV